MNAPTFDLVEGSASVRGHFLLESGLHAETWLDLESLFLDPTALAPKIAALARLIAPYDVTAICGPLLGGAFVAQAVAMQLRTKFYFAERFEAGEEKGLFQARYRLPRSQRRHAKHERFAVVDDVVSAGSSVRATVDELSSLGASIVVVGALLELGKRASDHFAPIGLPVVAPAFRAFTSWEPDRCPQCIAGVPLRSTR